MRQRKSAEERKSEIVETALRLADKVGPDRLSTEAIANAIRVSQPAIFRHFPTKQDLWEAVATRIGEKFQQRWLSVEGAEATEPEKLQMLINAQLKLIQATPAIPAILLSRELHARNERLRRLFYSMMERFHALIARTIEDGARNGHFRADIDARDAAFLVTGLVQGLVLRWSLSGRNFNLVDEGNRLLSFLLNSFGPPLQRSEVSDAREFGARAEDGTVPERDRS